jgi:hypothetical protein
LVEVTGGPGENHQPAASHWQTLSHNVVHLAWAGVEPTTSVNNHNVYFLFLLMLIASDMSF